MSAQVTYGYNPAHGTPGGLYDLAPYAIDTFLNEEETGVMKFGIGVVRGTKPGSNIALPTADADAAKFEGVTTNNRTTEHGLEGGTFIRKGAAMGVLRYGRIYVRAATDAAPVYGDPVCLVTDGDEAGFFTNTGGIALKGRFLSGADTDHVALIELFNQAQS